MHKIGKKVLRDEAERPIAVQIDYQDWLAIVRALDLQDDSIPSTDLSRHVGTLKLSEDPLRYQSRMRHEWL